MQVVSCAFQTVLLGAMTPLILCAGSSASIEGRITNSITGEPVGGVHVRFLDRRSHVYSAETDSTGSYRLTGLDDGDYQAEFTRDGFSDSRGNPFSYVSGFVPVRMDAQLKPWAVLRGRVLDEDLKPVAGIPVEKDPNRRGALDGNTVTNESGEFVFQDMAPGSYVVVARPETKFRIQDGVRLGTVPIYYPSATEPAEAVRIPVRTGQNVAGIEIRLKSVPVHRVTGVVLGEAGKPVVHATVKLMGPPGTLRKVLVLGMIMPSASAGGRISAGSFRPEIFTIVGPSPEPEMARADTHDDGTFEFAAVESGDWRLSVEDGIDGDMQRGGVASVSVSDKDIEDVRIRAISPFPIAAIWEGAKGTASAATAGMPFNLMPVEGQPRAIVADPGDLRKMSVFPGRYRVIPSAVQMNSATTAVMWGGRDVIGEVVDLEPGAAPFQAIPGSGLGKVDGTVEKGEGTTVFLVSRMPGEILTYRQVECRAGGAFEFGNVPAGDYYTVAFDRAETNGLSAADLPAVIASMAATVQVESDSAAQVNLSVNKWPR